MPGSAQAAQVRGCTALATLDRWIARAVTAVSVAQALAPGRARPRPRRPFAGGRR